MDGVLLDAPRLGIALQNIDVLREQPLRVFHNVADGVQTRWGLVGNGEYVGIEIGEGVANVRFQVRGLALSVCECSSL